MHTFYTVIFLLSLALMAMVVGYSTRLFRLSRARLLMFPIIIVLILLAHNLLVFSSIKNRTDLSLSVVVAEVLLILIPMVILFGIGNVYRLRKLVTDTNRALQMLQHDLETRDNARTTEITQTSERLRLEMERTEAAKAALRSAQMNFTDTLDRQPDRICRYRLDGTITFANLAYCDALKKTRDEVVGANVFDIVGDSHGDTIRNTIKQLSQDVSSLSSEQYMITPGGERWDQWTRYAIFDTDGNLFEIQAVGRDVTALYVAELARRESEEQMRQIVENLPLMVLAISADNKILMWNKECQRVTGYSSDEMLKSEDAFARLYPDPAYREEVGTAITLLQRNYSNYETSVTCKDGSERIIAWSNVSGQHPIPGWDRWATGVDITVRRNAERELAHARELLETTVAARTNELKAVQDRLEREITERKRAEIALRHSENQLRVTLDALDDIVYVVDTDLRIQLCNDAFMRFVQETGLETDPIGRTPFEVFPFLVPPIEDEYRKVFETGEPLISSERFQVGKVSITNETRRIPIKHGDGITHMVTVMHDVTDLQRRAEALRASEERYRLLSELVTDFVFALDVQPDGRVTTDWVAGAAEELTGYSSDRFADDGFWASLVHPDDYISALRALKTVLKGQPVIASCRIMAQGGTVRWVNLSAHPMLDPETGRTVRILGAIKDITAHKDAEEALVISEQKFRRFVEESQDGIYMIDSHGVIVEWNRAYELITGYARDDVIGRPAWEMLLEQVPEDTRLFARERIKESIMRLLAMDGDMPLVHTFTIQRPDGTRCDVHSVNFLLQTEQGVFVSGIARDVTGTVQSQDALRQSEQRMRMVIDVFPDVICLKDDEGRWLLANEANLALFGLSGTDYVGKSEADLVGMSTLHREIFDRCRVSDEWAWAVGEQVSIEETIPQPNGSQRTYDLIKLPRFDANGERKELLVVGRDVTGRKQAEKRTLQLLLERERSMILSGFIRDATHEFANPLSVIKNNIYLIQHAHGTEAALLRLDGIRDQVLYLEKMVEGLTTMAELDSSGAYEFETSPVRGIVESLYDSVITITNQKSLNVALIMPDDLPPVMMEARLLMRALRELVDNAIQHTAPEGLITLSASAEPPNIIIAVSDTGIGIGEDHLVHIFERFYRVDKSRVERRAGLGLSIARLIAEMHGGTITVESTLGVGSTFRVVLPIQPS